MSFNWKLTMGHLFSPFVHQLWKIIRSWMSRHNAWNLIFIVFCLFYNPILSKWDVWTHPTIPNFLLNHHLHRVSYSASICTWCPSITLEIVFFFSFSIVIFIHTKEDIKRVQQIMPKIGQLKGATRVHLLVFEDRNIKKKDLPNDSAWRPIRIKVGR